MAPSQDLRYEWSPFYRERRERFRVVNAVAFTPFIAIFTLGPVAGSFIGSGDIRKAFEISMIIFGFLTTLFLCWFVARLERREARRCDAFIARARAHGGWWFLHHHGARPTIVYTDELRPLGTDKVPRLLEPLDLLGCDDHQEIIRAEIRRLHALADGSRQVATQYLRRVQDLEGLLQPDFA